MRFIFARREIFASLVTHGCSGVFISADAIQVYTNSLLHLLFDIIPLLSANKLEEEFSTDSQESFEPKT